VRQRNFRIDLVEFFANITDGEFFDGVHRIPHDPGRSYSFCPDYSNNFFLKYFPNGYK
jgi:hypothetical protein